MKLIFITKEIIGRNIWTPIIEEALRRGYETILTDNPNTEGDIGFYCDDRSIPGKQKLTVITINGLDQDHVIRPNYFPWFNEENWGLFDIGLLPGERWAKGWASCGTKNSTNPRFGVYKVGWPKSDHMFYENDPAMMRLKSGHKRTVLYAPQTEQDGKQSQVLEALKHSNVKLFIKHWETPEEAIFYRHLLTKKYFENLNYENEKANNEKWVKVLDPKSNFIDALFNADILITDQSSVIYEAALGGIPTLSVIGWRHACNPCLGPQPSPDICLSSELSKLAENVDEIFHNYEEWVHKSILIRGDNFVNLGMSSKAILDLLINKDYLKSHSQKIHKELNSNLVQKILNSNEVLYIRRINRKITIKRIIKFLKNKIRNFSKIK